MTDATRALAYLWWRGFRNQWAIRLKRLRQPRYVVALLLGGLYMWGFVFKPRGFASDPQQARVMGSFYLDFAQLGLFVAAISAWFSETARLSLAFTPGEAAFLFPGPVTRRGLLVYKLLRAQGVVLFNVILWVVILRRQVTPLSAWLRGISVWLTFSTLYTHRVFATLVRTSWGESGDRALTARRITRGVALAVGAAIAWVFVDTFVSIRGMHGFDGLIDTVAAALVRQPAVTLFAPVRWLLLPTFATNAADWRAHIGAAAGLFALVTLAVLVSRVPFEEAAMQASTVRAERVSAWRQRRMGAARLRPKPGAKRRSLPLRSTGAPEVALAWKNFLGMWRSGPWVLFVTLLFAWAFIIAMAIESEAGRSMTYAFAVAPLIAVAVMVVFGPRAIRLDLRADLIYLSILKTAPLRGRRIVLAEIGAATLMLTMAQWLMLAVTVVATLSLGRDAPGTWWWTPALIVLPFACLAINALGFTIQNGVVVLVPSWVQLGAVVGGGVEVVGQALLATISSLLALVIMLIPAGLVFTAVAWYARWQSLGIAIAGASAVVCLFAEIWAATWYLGGVFDRLEPTSLT